MIILFKMDQQDIIPEIASYHHMFDGEHCEIQKELGDHSYNPIDKFLNKYSRELFNYDSSIDRRENPEMIVWDIQIDIRRFIVYNKHSHSYHLNTTTTHSNQNFDFLNDSTSFPPDSYTFMKYDTGFDTYCIVDTMDYRIPLMITTGMQCKD
jgi:hypothetical protein